MYIRWIHIALGVILLIMYSHIKPASHNEQIHCKVVVRLSQAVYNLVSCLKANCEKAGKPKKRIKNSDILQISTFCS